MKHSFPDVQSKSQYNGCTVKRAYASERIAMRTAQERMAVEHVVLRAYKCKHCKQFHLTSQRQRNEN